ncbi:MAG: Gfo/Idh/MocA family oxidoreductase [Anaerolineaceae bacterium]|nr:Gfo/Idh/MocA family oxidoreductase [Anaerolineaceae bacterium]
MKQLLQNIREGKAEIAEIPVPVIKPGFVLVKNVSSVVSVGTERMIVSFAEKSLLGKAKSRPDLVKQVLDKAKREGILPTIEAAFNKLDQPMALGYSSAGIVEQVGEGVQNISPGMRVACAGGGFATHSEYVLVPKNLIAPFSEQITFEEAAFTTLGAISLQGFRLANPQVGEKIAIIGLGILGCLLADIAKAAGCKVLGIDLDPDRVEFAKINGLTAVTRENAISQASTFTSNKGFDSVFICADTKSNDPVDLAGVISRDRGVIVAVGAVGLNIPRKNYYEKELTFLISRSYGPGRYDNDYEENGVDYPYGYVRWTEGRNLETIISLMEDGKLIVKSLISHRFPIEDGTKAYDVITGKTKEPFMGVVLNYNPTIELTKDESSTRINLRKEPGQSLSNVNVGILGAGLYAGAVFLPVIEKVGGLNKVGICSAKGLNANHLAKKYSYSYACTDENQILDDPNINSVVILTRHNDHARQIIHALEIGKHVYCEKPLTINEESLVDIQKSIEKSKSILMVGFNRRFSSMAIKMKEFLNGNSEPLNLHYRINAGLLPLNHWLHDPEVGGGRIIGEGCHFVDFLLFLTGKKPVSVNTFGLPDLGKYKEDNVTMIINFEDGSLGTIEYLANGDKSYPKEYLEIFAGGKIVQLNDFRRLLLIENNKKSEYKSSLSQDKGHAGAWKAFLKSIKTGQDSPISFSELYSVAQATFAAVQSLREHHSVQERCA